MTVKIKRYHKLVLRYDYTTGILLNTIIRYTVLTSVEDVEGALPDLLDNDWDWMGKNNKQ